MIRGRPWWWKLVVVALILVAGAFLLRSRAATAFFLLDRGLVHLPSDPTVPAGYTVRYEAGAQAHAVQIAAILRESVLQVERAHGRAFRQPISVVVCASQATFNRRTARPSQHRGRGLATRARVYLSPRAFAFDGVPGQVLDTHRAILVHELSHAHLLGHLGPLAYRRRLPRWFQEGLAVWVSEGGGAEAVSTESAVAAMRGGRVLRPDNRGHLWQLRTPASYGLSHPMLYRQGFLLVDFLASRDPHAFALVLRSLLDGAEFESSLQSSYGVGLDSLSRQWLDGLNSAVPE